MTQQVKNTTWDIIKVAGTLAFVGLMSWMMIKADERYVQKETYRREQSDMRREYERDRSADQMMLQEMRSDIKQLLRQTK